MRFVSRSEWGARRPKATTRISGPVYGVTLHWEGPDMGQPGPHVWPHSQCDNYVRQIQDFHLDGRGWSDIAYSGVVCAHGYVFEGRGADLRTAANGTNGGNDHWYALCYLGGQGDAFTDDGMQGFRDGVDWLRRKGNAGDRVNGHRDHKPTACPGDVIYRWLRNTSWKNLQEEDDMPSAKEVAEAVWRAEQIPAEPANKDNPTWQPRNVLNLLIRQNNAVMKAIEAMATSLPESVQQSVVEALKDATVQVDVNVTGANEQEA